MSDPFKASFRVGWGDLDFNGHMRNTAFLDRAADTRMLFFDTHGFSMREFERLRFGPVIQRDELTYAKELRMLEPYEVTLALAAVSPDGARWRLENRFFRGDGKLAAVVLSSGGWLSLETRKLAPPPEGIRAALEHLAHAENFEALPALK